MIGSHMMARIFRDLTISLVPMFYSKPPVISDLLDHEPNNPYRRYSFTVSPRPGQIYRVTVNEESKDHE